MVRSSTTALLFLLDEVRRYPYPNYLLHVVHGIPYLCVSWRDEKRRGDTRVRFGHAWPAYRGMSCPLEDDCLCYSVYASYVQLPSLQKTPQTHLL
jgi:hypothetical protein